MASDNTIVEEKIKQFLNRLAEYVTVDKAILYGSWAKGNPTEFSDIDLAIFSFDFGKHRLKELELLSRIAWEVDAPIEAIPYPTHQLLDANPARFVYEIISTGQTVFDRNLNQNLKPK